MFGLKFLFDGANVTKEAINWVSIYFPFVSVLSIVLKTTELCKYFVTIYALVYRELMRFNFIKRKLDFQPNAIS